ncbi:hypothetical protein, partial [Microcystis aeruginosa]|uniref:hypothetical protein n=1 Tax=Microcystis aeruginosa TaxID=1126 RepID=UPI00232F4AC1
ENRGSKPCIFIGPRPVGAKHSGNNLSVKPEIFYPNASPVLFAANPIYSEKSTKNVIVVGKPQISV